MKNNKGEVLLFQENDEAVSKHCHSNKEVGKRQPVPRFPNLPLMTIVAIKQNRVLEVALKRPEPVSKSNSERLQQNSDSETIKSGFSLAPSDQMVSRS